MQRSFPSHFYAIVEECTPVRHPPTMKPFTEIRTCVCKKQKFYFDLRNILSSFGSILSLADSLLIFAKIQINRSAATTICSLVNTSLHFKETIITLIHFHQLI